MYGHIQTGHTDFLPPQVCGSSRQGLRLGFCTCHEYGGVVGGWGVYGEGGIRRAGGGRIKYENSRMERVEHNTTSGYNFMYKDGIEDF